MQIIKLLIPILISLATGFATFAHAASNVTKSNTTTGAQTYNAQKLQTIRQMYEQDIRNEGMDNPVVLQQYANTALQNAMQLEQTYFETAQMSCHVGYDVLWNSQDPDYQQDKQFAITDKGLVKVSLAQGGDVYYDLICDNKNCQVADVILTDQGKSLREHLLKACR